MKVTAEERKKLKGNGVLSCRDGEHFALRVITKNGVMTAEQMTAAAATAQKYGDGQVCFTTRLTAEIMNLPYEHIAPAIAMLEKAGLATGGTGAKVRPVVACKGSYCVFGLCDTQGVAERLHREFYDGYRDAQLPHKFKLAVGGCPNNCVKPDLNDVGLVGARTPGFHKDVCRGCKTCFLSTVCPVDAICRDGDKVKIDETKCVQCGKCFSKCPFQAVPEKSDGFKIYIGGRWGKVCRKGDLLDGIFSEDEAVAMVEKAILLFKENAYAGERFGAMIDRIGIGTVKQKLSGDDLLNRKAKILAQEVLKRPEAK